MRDILLFWIVIFKRHLKCFTVKIKNSKQNIAVERSKSAFLGATWGKVDTPVTLPSLLATDVIKETGTKSESYVR